MVFDLKLPLLTLGFSVFSCAVSAAPTVTFQGEVSSQTCSIEINGQTNSIVMLQAASTTDFGTPLANGQTAGASAFTVSIAGCTAPATTAQNIKTTFLGYDVDAASGVLGNRATGATAARGYGIQLTTSASGGNGIMLSGPTAVPGLVLPVGATSASYDFGVQYFVIDAASATPGSITAVAEYTLSYL